MSKWIVESIGAPGVGSMADYETVTMIPVQDTPDILSIKICCKRGAIPPGVQCEFPFNLSPRMVWDAKPEDCPRMSVHFRAKPSGRAGVYGPTVQKIRELLSLECHSEGLRIRDIMEKLELSEGIVNKSLYNHKGKLFMRLAFGLWTIKKELMQHVAS